MELGLSRGPTPIKKVLPPCFMNWNGLHYNIGEKQRDALLSTKQSTTPYQSPFQTTSPLQSGKTQDNTAEPTSVSGPTMNSRIAFCLELLETGMPSCMTWYWSPLWMSFCPVAFLVWQSPYRGRDDVLT